MYTKGGSSIAFVEYADIRQATQAMTSLQGFQISGSDRGGMRIEFAKNKMSDINGKSSFYLNIHSYICRFACFTIISIAFFAHSFNNRK